MGLARELVELETSLRSNQSCDAFVPLTQGGLMGSPEFVRLVSDSSSPMVLRLCLQALRIQYTELTDNLAETELVATLPSDYPTAIRPTNRVITEMLERAEREILIIGYEFSDKALILSLAKAAQRGVSVVVICNRGRPTSALLSQHWLSAENRPKVYQNRRRQKSPKYASMHAKCLIADASQMLVTSANFTFHGLFGNIELGVRVVGRAAAEAREVLRHLIDSRTLEEIVPDAPELPG